MIGSEGTNFLIPEKQIPPTNSQLNKAVKPIVDLKNNIVQKTSGVVKNLETKAIWIGIGVIVFLLITRRR